MNSVAPVVGSDGVIGPTAEMGALFSSPRGYGISSAGSFRISGGSFRNKSRTGPSPAAISMAAEDIERAHIRHAQDQQQLTVEGSEQLPPQLPSLWRLTIHSREPLAYLTNHSRSLRLTLPFTAGASGVAGTTLGIFFVRGCTKTF